MRSVVAALLLACSSTVAFAESIHGNTQTVVNLFPEQVARELNIVAPFVQWVTLRAERLAGEDLSVHLSGWGGFDLGNALFPGRGAGDLSLAHLRWQDRQRGVALTLGRQYLFLGLSRTEHIDGLRVVKDLPAGFQVQIFGGARAGLRLKLEPGSWMAGGRVSHRWGRVLTSGITFLQSRQQDALQRELIGADIVARPLSWLEIGAGSLYDTIGYELAQLDLFMTFYPRRGLRISVDWRRIVPVALLDKTSIFSVFSNAVRNEGGGDVSYRFGRRFTLRADAHLLRFDDGEHGYRVGIGGSVRTGRGSVATFRVGRWADAVGAYTVLRGALRQSLYKKLYGVLDAQAYLYDNDARGSVSFGVTAALGYELGKRLRALLSTESGITAEFTSRVQVLAKLEYNFSTSF